MARITWKWKNFMGGEADNARKGPDGSFQNAEGVDIRKYPGEVRLSGALTDTGWLFLDNIIFMENLDKYGGDGIVVATNDGKVYLNGSIKQTISTGTNSHNRIAGMAYMKSGGTDYLYFISQTSSGAGKIHRSTMDLLTWNIGHISYTTNNGGVNKFDKSPTISEETRFIFGAGGRVFSVDNVETISTKLTLSDIDEVVGLSVFQTQYRVYSNINSINSSQYFWDGTSTDYDYKTEWNNLPITGTVNDGGYDIGVVGFSRDYSDLYQIAGSQRSEIRVNLEESLSGRKFDPYISIREGMYYISGGKNQKAGIYTMGNYYPGFPKSLVLEYPLDSNLMLHHAHDITTSYFACNDDKVYKVSHANPNGFGYNTTGYIESLKFDGGDGYAYIEKQIDYAYVGFNKTTSNKTIQLYARANGGTYKLLKTIDNNHSNQLGVRIDRTEFQAQGLGDFYELEYKAVLSGDGGTQETSTPIFKGVETYITVNIKK